MEPVRGTKPHSMYEKSDIKTNIIRYYFVAYHSIDKATSGTEGQDQSRETDECICNLHTWAMLLCARAEKHLLASRTYQHFPHSQSRVTRDSLCQCVTCLSKDRSREDI